MPKEPTKMLFKTYNPVSLRNGRPYKTSTEQIVLIQNDGKPDEFKWDMLVALRPGWEADWTKPISDLHDTFL